MPVHSSRRRTILERWSSYPKPICLHNLWLSPLSLLYAYLHDGTESPVIISDKLSDDKTSKLTAVLEKHRYVLSYSLQDHKRISTMLCTHRILLDPSCAPSWELQRGLNNSTRDVVKLQHVGIIYPIPYSEWVSPVQVVPGGMTVIENSITPLLGTTTSPCPSLMIC